MLRIAIIISSTRAGRVGESVGHWAIDIARKRTDADLELVDLHEFRLPLLDEPMAPALGQYSRNIHACGLQGLLHLTVMFS
jgi:NAD(P)H-dependent FMN reductase